MTNEELWQAALGEIELSISKANYITWFKNTFIISFENNIITLGVPNGFSKEWLENKYRSNILKALKIFQPSIQNIICVINIPKEVSTFEKVANLNPFVKKSLSEIKTSDNFSNRLPCKNNLNPRYRFNNFIIGSNNELARAACYAVSENLGHAYNPLFIYGGVGLGKTHLLQAIGNEILIKDPLKNIKYISSESFASDLIESIKTQKISAFKEEYQKYDLLILDDIQFLSGKEKTQHEFFHIFNDLYQINKQIVLSSDRAPKAIAALEERLRSRFEGGMIVDVIQPDLETRIAILKTKSEEKGFFIEENVLKFIAENIKNNIREMEGALNKLIASCQLTQKNPSLDLAEKVLSEIISSGRKKGVQIKDIINLVADFYNISPEKLIQKGRKKDISSARQMAMYLSRTELKLSYPSIGDQFGGRDHTTTLHAFEKISKEILINKKISEDLSVLKERLYKI